MPFLPELVPILEARGELALAGCEAPRRHAHSVTISDFPR